MAGGLMMLLGPLEARPTEGRPEITFYKVTYKRRTNFVVEKKYVADKCVCCHEDKQVIKCNTCITLMCDECLKKINKNDCIVCKKQFLKTISKN